MWKHIVRSRTFGTDDVVKCYPDVIISFEKSNSVGTRQNGPLGAGCMHGPSVFFLGLGVTMTSVSSTRRRHEWREYHVCICGYL